MPFCTRLPLSLLMKPALASFVLTGVFLAEGIGVLAEGIGPSAARAATPSAEQALKLQPIQKDVEFDRPTAAAELAKCTIKAEKTSGKTGWVVRDGSGQTLRNFVDTNADNIVDQWSYYKDGVEVYRDIDSNFNGKADQCRWLNTAGTRWGLLASDDGKDTRVESWKQISAEEVTAELVAALRDADVGRFERLLLTSQELQALGLGPAKSAEVSKLLAGARASFKDLLKQQKVVGPQSHWAYFGATRPGLVPAGTDDSQSDVVVYENVSAMVETAGKHTQLPVGSLVKVNETWRLVDAPTITSDGSAEPDGGGIFIPGPVVRRPDAPGGGRPSERKQQLLTRLEKLDKAPAGNPAELDRQNVERAEILEELAKEDEAAGNGEQRLEWLKQFADTVSAATQAGAFPDGVARLKAQFEQVKNNPADADLAAYVQFRFMTAEYSENLRKPGADSKYQQIQVQWLKDLDSYLENNAKTVDGPEAMLQLANGLELAGEEAKALKWYTDLIATAPPDSPAGIKGRGAKTRLESVGKPMRLNGKTVVGATTDLTKYRGKVVLVHYWAAEYSACQVDIPLLQALVAKYGKNFAILGVSLDNDPKKLAAYLKQNRLPWEQIYEGGGLDGRLANEMGILTMPTMILVDQQGRVINRGTHAAELDGELNSLNLLKPVEKESAGRETQGLSPLGNRAKLNPVEKDSAGREGSPSRR